MITANQMYWITRMDDIRLVGWILSVLGVSTAIVMAHVYSSEIGGDSWEDLVECLKRFVRRTLMSAAISVATGLVVIAFVPSTRDTAAILVVPKLANSESVAEIADSVKTLAVEWLEELRPGKDGK